MISNEKNFRQSAATKTAIRFSAPCRAYVEKNELCRQIKINEYLSCHVVLSEGGAA